MCVHTRACVCVCACNVCVGIAAVLRWGFSCAWTVQEWVFAGWVLCEYSSQWGQLYCKYNRGKTPLSYRVLIYKYMLHKAVFAENFVCLLFCVVFCCIFAADGKRVIYVTVFYLCTVGGLQHGDCSVVYGSFCCFCLYFLCFSLRELYLQNVSF